LHCGDAGTGPLAANRTPRSLRQLAQGSLVEERHRCERAHPTLGENSRLSSHNSGEHCSRASNFKQKSRIRDSLYFLQAN
jgi:hypothetical protein